MGRRFTVIHGGGRRSEVADNWSETWETTGWTGYTLFLQRQVEGPPQHANQSQSSTQQAAETQLDEAVEEDGSFELVEDDEGSGDVPARQEGPGSGPHHGDRSSGPRLRAMSLLSSATGATGSSVSSASTRLDADEGEIGSEVLQGDQKQEQEAAGDKEQRQQEAADEGSEQKDQREVERERPWEMQMLQEFPYQTDADQWSGILSGWLIRLHGRKRTRLFNPLNRRTPNMKNLSINRTTVLFLDDGTRLVKHDEWVSAHKRPDGINGQQWRGFTFFKLKSNELGQHGGIQEEQEQEEVEFTYMDPSSMASTQGQSSKGKGSSSTTGAKGASAMSSTGATSFQLEDSIPGGKGPGSASPEHSPKGKGYPKQGTTPPKVNKMSPTTKGTSVGNVDGVLECVDVSSLRPGSNIAGQSRPALRYFAVMSDGRGGLDELCPGKPKPKRVSLKPARHGVSDREGERESAPVTLKPSRAHEQQEQEDEVQLVEDSPQAEGESSRRMVLADGGGLSPEEGEVPAQAAQEHPQGEEDRPAEGSQPGADVETQEGPKLKKYRRVRVKKKQPQLEKEIREMHSMQRTRAERLACLRLLQQERQEKQQGRALPEQQEATPQPRTPSPSSVDWKAAEEETKRQMAEAKAAGRRNLTYEEWDKERREKNEKWRQERKRKEWVEKEVARRKLQEERGEEREAVLRSAASSTSRPLTDKEWEQMQEMAKHLPAAPARPKKDDQQPGDEEASTMARPRQVMKETKYEMQPPNLPGPPPPGYTGIWRGGCCPGFRMRGYPGGGDQHAHGHQQGPGGYQYRPQGHQSGPWGHRPELQGQQRPPTQQNMSIDLGPTLPYTVPNTRAVGTCNRMA